MPKKSTISSDDYQDTYGDHLSQQSNLSRVGQKEVQKSKKKASAARRNIKTYDQIVVLNKYYAEDPTWNRRTVQKCKKLLGLKTSVIYKWGYDRKQAELREKKHENFNKSRNEKKYLTDVVCDYNATVDFIVSQLKQSNPKTFKKEIADSKVHSDAKFSQSLNLTAEFGSSKNSGS